MLELLKLLNDLNPAELSALNEAELTRLESLCEKWAKLAETERGRRKSLPG